MAEELPRDLHGGGGSGGEGGRFEQDDIRGDGRRGGPVSAMRRLTKWRSSGRRGEAQGGEGDRLAHSGEAQDYGIGDGVAGESGGLPRCWRGPVELSVDGSRGIERCGQGAAHQAKDAYGEGHRGVIDFECEAWLRVGDVGDGSGEQEMAVAGGPEAGEVVERLLRVMEGSLAAGIDVECGERGELLAVGIDDTQTGFHDEVAHVARYVGFGAEVAAPAAIAAEHEAADLAQLRAAPFGVKLERQLVERGGAGERAIEAHGSGVFEFEVAIGPGGLRLKAYAPLIGVSKPDGGIGVEEGEGFFFVAFLEVDSGRMELDVGEARGQRWDGAAQWARWRCARPGGAARRNSSVRSGRGRG